MSLRRAPEYLLTTTFRVFLIGLLRLLNSSGGISSEFFFMLTFLFCRRLIRDSSHTIVGIFLVTSEDLLYDWREIVWWLLSWSAWFQGLGLCGVGGGGGGGGGGGEVGVGGGSVGGLRLV